MITLHLHPNTFNACITKKTKILFLIRGSHGIPFLMKNLPIINQTKHPTKRGRKSYKMERTQVLANERILQGGVDGNGGEKGTRSKDPSPGK